MHQKASDIMLWVFFSRMKCNLQTTSPAARKRWGSTARSRMGLPRTHRHPLEECRAGPGLYFSPFLGQKNYILFPNPPVLCKGLAGPQRAGPAGG